MIKKGLVYPMYEMKFYIFAVLFIYVVICSAETPQPEVCLGVNTIEEANGRTNASLVSETDTGSAFLIVQPSFTCCGVIKLWKAHIKQNGTIKFDIWRSLSDGKNFKLVGSHEFRIAVSSDVLMTLSIPPGAQYTVYPGDNIGWYTPVKEMIAYTVNGSSQVKSFNSRPSSHPLGSVLNWSTASPTINTYAIGAQYDVNSAPKFVNLDADIRVVPPIAIGTVIYTISATDPDISDTSITQLTYRNTNGNGLFSFNSTTRHVIVNASLTATAGYHCLTFEVEDICQKKDTGSLCIFIYNEPPTVTCNPQTATIIETTSGNVALTTVVVSDPTDDVTCIAPNIAPFSLKLENEYKIYVNANPGFRVATRDLYNVRITCNDTKNSTTAMCNIQILPSAPPRFVNLPGFIPVSTVNVKTDPVYEVSVTDPDSKSFNFSIFCMPISCPFTINKGSIQLEQELVDHTIGGYDVYITVTDGYNSVTDTLTVIISDVNVPPKFINLPLTTVLSVPENTALGSSVYKVSATDIDGDALTYSMTSSPVTGMTYFSIDRSSGIICTSTVRAINYEETKNTTWTFTVSVDDGKLTVHKDLLIRVSNLNEGLSFSQPIYRIVANESLAGTLLPDPGFLVNDPDNDDSHTFTHDCSTNTGYFTMNPLNGILTFAVDYDLDVPGKAKMITCIVTATDRAGLTATATLLIVMNEINDHPPTFQYASYKFYAYNDSVVGLVLGSISATDADIGTNGQFVYNVNRTGSSHEYFNVSSNGQVNLQKSLNGIADRTKLDFTVYATDYGSPTRTGFTTVTVIVLEGSAETVSTTTIVFRRFIQDERNIVCITFLSLLALSTTLLTVWICWRTNSTWPTGFDPFEECIRNCTRPSKGRDYGNGNRKGSNRTRPEFTRSHQSHPEKPKNQPSTHQPQSEKPKNQPSTHQPQSEKPKNQPSTHQPQSEKPKNQPSTHQPQSEKPENQPSIRAQMSYGITQSKRPSRVTHSPIRPEGDPNFRVNDFLT